MAAPEHVDEERLLAFTLGHLDAAATAQVQDHLSTCFDCKRKQESLSSGAFSKTAVGTSRDGEPLLPGNPTRVDGAGGAGVGLERGATLGRYVLLEKLGAGGMGEVFAAYDPQLDRKVAVKLLRGGALSAQEGKARLLREAQAMARLQHPNVIAVHDVGVFNDRVFIAMEYVEGETLAEWLREKRPWVEVVRVFLQSGSGLAAAHNAGLIHRDFKPENVLLGTDNRPRVLDFGLARQSSATPAPVNDKNLPADVHSDSSLALRLTQDGAVMGTPGYMAPEQISGLVTDARSDQFSFCVALWEALYGQRPFSGSTLRQHAAQIAAGQLTPPPSDSKVPEWVSEVAKRGLAANPVDRWPDMDALLRALRPRARSNPRRVLFLIGLVLFSVFGIGYGVWTRQRLLVCGGNELRLAGTWDGPRKAKLREGFARTGLSYANESWTNAERALDAWAAEWVVTARDVCEASKLRKSDSPEMTELKNACLEERLQRLEAVVALFDSPDHDVVANAPLAARDLESATTCTSPAALRRSSAADERERAADTVLRAKLAEARALFAAGKYAVAAERLKSSLTPTASPAAQAEAYLWVARIELKRGEPKLARSANLTAAEQALKSGESALAARALSRLYASEGFDENDSDADAWSRLASASAARVPGDWEVQTELAQNDGLVNLRRKRFKAALSDFETVLTLQQNHLGSEHPDVASTLNNLGVVLTWLEKPQEAFARYEESLRLHEQLEGAEHPNVATALHNLAVALKRMGKTHQAREAFERALAIRRKALGFNHPDSLRSAQSLVRLLLSLAELEAAQTLLTEVRETRTTLSGADSPEMLTVLDLEAELFLAGGYWKEALETGTKHLSLARLRGNAGTSDVNKAMLEQTLAWTQLGMWSEARKTINELQRRLAAKDDTVDAAMLDEAIGRLELAQGHAALAVPPLQRAIELREKSNPVLAARTALILARALAADGKGEATIEQLSKAETLFSENECTRLLLEAQVARAEAVASLRPTEAQGAIELLKSLEPQLAEPQRVGLKKWLSEHDAGVP